MPSPQAQVIHIDRPYGTTFSDSLSGIGRVLTTIYGMKRAEQDRQMEIDRRRQEAEVTASRLSAENLAQQVQSRDIASKIAEEQAIAAGPAQIAASLAPGGQATVPGALPLPGIDELAGPPSEGTPTEATTPLIRLPGITRPDLGLNIPSETTNPGALYARMEAESRRKIAQTGREAQAGWPLAPNDMTIGAFNFKKGEPIPPPLAAIGARPQKEIERVESFGGYKRTYYVDGTTKDEPMTVPPGTEETLALRRELAEDRKTTAQERADEKKAAAEEAVESAVQSLLNGIPLQQIRAQVKTTAENEARRRGGVDGEGGLYDTPKTKEMDIEYSDIISKATQLTALLKDKEVRGYIGPLSTRATEFARGMPEIPFLTPKIPDKVNKAIALMNDLSDAKLRERSGAAISPKEFERIIKFAADPTARISVTLSNLESMIQYAKSNRRTILGGGTSPKAPRAPVGKSEQKLSIVGPMVVTEE